jgi:CheY-like chemotaxis protein
LAAESARILVADDDPDDILLLKEAVAECEGGHRIQAVSDGQELMDALLRGEKKGESRPDLILLDLNMHRKNGFEVLQELKADPLYRGIPVVIWTTSRREEDVVRTYAMGCNAYMTKPSSFDGLVAKMQGLTRFWFQQVDLPGRRAV